MSTELGSVGSGGMERRLRKLPFPSSTGHNELIGSFYNGGNRENGILSRAYEQVAKHVHTVFKVSYA